MRAHSLHLLYFTLLYILCSVTLADSGTLIPQIAVIPFEAKGDANVTEAEAITQLVEIHLSANNDLTIIDRMQLGNVVSETALNMSGLVGADKAIQYNNISGANTLINGTLFKLYGTTILTIKAISTETSASLSASVESNAGDDLPSLARAAATKIAALIIDNKDSFLASPSETQTEQLDTTNNTIRLSINISEEHLNSPSVDPAAETECMKIALDRGFRVVDPDSQFSNAADFTIKGEGFSQFAAQLGDLVSVKARVEVKVLNSRTGDIIAADRETAVDAELSEMIAAKNALQKAAKLLCGRVLTRLARQK